MPGDLEPQELLALRKLLEDRHDTVRAVSTATMKIQEVEAELQARAEKDRQSEEARRALHASIREVDGKVSKLHAALLMPPEGDKAGRSFYARALAVIYAYETSTTATKWVVRFIATTAVLAGAVTTIYATGKGWFIR